MTGDPPDLPDKTPDAAAIGATQDTEPVLPRPAAGAQPAEGPSSTPPTLDDGAADTERAANRGEVIAQRYRIEAMLGSGGMGQVYRATQLGLDRDVALKLISPSRFTSGSARNAFEREARVASTLRHPDAVQVYDFGPYERGMFMAMELVHGLTLRDALVKANGVLSPGRAVKIAGRVADVLVAAHRLGLVHRDLKPENIMLERAPDGSDRPRVTDFGLAFLEGGERGLGRVTRGQLVSGTPQYMAPEQASGERVGVAVDLYALGCVLFEMLVGRPPLQDRSLAALLAKQLYRRPPRLHDADPRLVVPQALEDLVDALLSKDPQHRPSAAATRDSLLAMDPQAPEREGQSAQPPALTGRVARMVKPPRAEPQPTPPSTTTAPRSPSPPRLEVGVVGDLEPELVLGLETHGIQTLSVDGPDAVSDLPVVLLFDPDQDTVERWRTRGCAVIAVLATSDFEELAKQLRFGAAEVATAPLEAARLGQLILRAVRRRQRDA